MRINKSLQPLLYRSPRGMTGSRARGVPRISRRDASDRPAPAEPQGDEPVAFRRDPIEQNPSAALSASRFIAQALEELELRWATRLNDKLNDKAAASKITGYT